MKLSSAYPSAPAAVLRIAGEDHEEFLQNQGTADLTGEPGLCRYSLWLDYKGRIQADAVVLKLDKRQMLLVSYDCPAASLVEKFNAHIISEDVIVIDETAEWQLYSTPESENLPGREGDEAFTLLGSGYAFPGRRLGTGSTDFLIPSHAALPVVDYTLSGQEAEALRIQSGVPGIPRDTGSGFLNPVECGILSALSFNKGCYLGQEVVARVHRMQRMARRLAVLRGMGPVPTPPFEIHLNEDLVGCLSSVASSGDGFVAMGWLKSSLVKEGKVNLPKPLELRCICQS